MDGMRKVIAILRDKDQLGQLEILVTSFGDFCEFLNDELNISVLKKYCLNSDGNIEKCTLGLLCKNVWEKLDEIYRLFNEYSNNHSPKIDGHTDTGIYMPYSFQDLRRLSNKITDVPFVNLLSAYKVLKHLDGHSKTLIILGPNGSGKTSFANFLKNMDVHVKVIPASKPLKAAGHIPNIYNSSLSNYNDELYKGGVLNHDLMQKLIIGMCTDHDDIARKYMDTRKTVYI